MYISDCYRYALEHQKSRNAAEFMRILVPDDPESHMRLGINVSMLTDSAEALVPFYYYCVFLANREVDVNHPEAVVVSRFVQSVRRTELGDDENDLATRRRFAVLFVDALWSILKTDFDRANEKIKEKRLWDTLGQYLMGVPSEGEILHVIGALIFVHHRVSPLGNQDGKILLQCDLTDFAARKAIEILSKHVAQSLSKFNAAVRTRKRNRRRALQKKKRRRDGTPMEPGVADSVTRDLLKEIINLEKSVPHLGALSFLTHYWSVSRAAPKQTSEFPGLAAALRNMTEVVQELDKLAEVTGSVSIIGQVATKVFGGTSGQIPALLEDIMFSAFSPCRNVNMFRNIRMQDVPFPSLLGTPRTDFVRSAMLEVGNGTYESVVGGIARRHLEAFAQLCNTEAGGRAIDKDAMAALVTVAIRKLRIQRLVRGLEKTGGGRVLRMANTTPQASRGEPVSQQQASELFPPAGQPDPNEDSSLQQEISSGELAVRLKKRRRVIGTSSLAFADREDTGSLSCRSSEEKGSESLFMPRPQSNIANSEARQQNPEDGMMEEPASRAGDGGRIRRGVSRGSLLSQGSLQLCYAQPPEPNNQNKQDSSKETASKESDSASLSRILRDILYPKNSVIISPPRNLSGPAFWRSSPSQEYAQNIVRIGAVIEDQVK